jgi:FlaA1/EpsC-like NDP-sugar epimerase
MRRTVLVALWLISDLLLFLGSYALAYFIRVGWVLSTDFPFSDFFTAVLLVSPVWLFTLIGTRTFALMRKQSSKRTIAYIGYAGVVASAVFSLAYYFLYGAFFSRGLLLLALVFSIAGTWIWHLCFGLIMRRLMRRNPPAYPTLIVGATREAASLLQSMRKNESPLTPVAILDGRGVKETEIEGIPVVGKLNKLEETIATYKISHLIQCSDLEQSINLLSACRSHGISYMLLPSVLGIVERDERIESLEGRPVTVVRPKESAWTWFFR